jgi:integrase
MLAWVEYVRREKDKNAKLFNISYNRAYRIIKKAGEKIGEDFPPHRLRAERATQLVLEYGFDDHELTEWFHWKSPVVAHEYTTLAPKIMEKMFRSSLTY